MWIFANMSLQAIRYFKSKKFEILDVEKVVVNENKGMLEPLMR